MTESILVARFSGQIYGFWGWILGLVDSFAEVQYTGELGGGEPNTEAFAGQQFNSLNNQVGICFRNFFVLPEMVIIRQRLKLYSLVATIVF